MSAGINCIAKKKLIALISGSLLLILQAIRRKFMGNAISPLYFFSFFGRHPNDAIFYYYRSMNFALLSLSLSPASAPAPPPFAVRSR